MHFALKLYSLALSDGFTWKIMIQPKGRRSKREVHHDKTAKVERPTWKIEFSPQLAHLL